MIKNLKSGWRTPPPWRWDDALPTYSPMHHVISVNEPEQGEICGRIYYPNPSTSSGWDYYSVRRDPPAPPDKRPMGFR